MSALGQKQTYAAQHSMSALPPKADMCGAPEHVRFGLIADSCTAAKGSLFDHLVGTGEQRRRNCEAKRLGGLEIDYQLVLGRRLYRETGRLFTLKDTINIKSGLPCLLHQIGAVRNQPTIGDKSAPGIDRW